MKNLNKFFVNTKTFASEGGTMMINKTARGKPASMPKGFAGWNLINGELGHVMLKDVLHNLAASENGDSKDAGHIVGVMAALMACGMTFDEAAQFVWQHLPDNVSPDRVPKCWHENFESKFAPKYLVKIDTDQGVYVLYAGGGYTILGFDVAYDNALTVSQWLKAEGKTAEPAIQGDNCGLQAV